MVHHSSPEAGALRSAAPSHQIEATNNLQSHASELRMSHGLYSRHISSASSDVVSGNTLDVPPISDVTGGTKTSDTSRADNIYNIYRNAEVTPTRAPLDGTKSLSDMAKAGALKDMTAATAPMERPKAIDGQAPTIKVQFSDITAANKTQPDFVVKQDGSIQMNNNIEQSGQKDIVIEVERQNGQLMPSEAQQKAIDELYQYLDARVKEVNPEAAKNGVKIEDPQDLVSKETEQAAKARQQDSGRQAPAELGPAAEEQTQRMNRFRGSGSGQMSRSEANDYFPERSVPRQANENDRLAAMKDVVAGFTSKGAERPYEHVVHRGNRGWGVGRYGMTYDNLSNWLANLDIDNLEELERQGKVPKGTAARMKAMKASLAKHGQSGKDSDLDPFLQKLKAGDKNNPITAQDINENFGKEVQELAATHQVGRYAEEMGRQSQNLNPGEVALAFMTGKVPTAEDLQNPENKRFVDAANQSYQIALGRYETPGDGPVKFSDTAMDKAMQDAVGKQLWRGYDSATQNGNLGCAITVSRILRAGGLDVGNELSVNGLRDKMEQIGAKRVSLNDAMASGEKYVIIKKQGGSHTGIGQGRTVVENSSSLRRTVMRDISESSLKSGSYAYILPNGKNG